jgi:RimJ/RimL family protein N-acetyltransferase
VTSTNGAADTSDGGTGAAVPLPQTSLSLETRRLQLRILTNEDHAPLYRLACDPEVTFQWRFRGTTPSYDDFLKQLYPGVLCQFVVSPRGSQEVLGLVIAYNADFRHRFCYAAVVMHPRLHRSGMGVEAFMALARYIYYGWDFRMILMETVGLAFENFASGERAGYFTVEGRIRDQFYYGGRYWDGLSITHSRAQFEMVMGGRYARILAPGRPVHVPPARS